MQKVKDWEIEVRRKRIFQDWIIPKNRPEFLVAPAEVYDLLPEWYEYNFDKICDIHKSKYGFSYGGIPIIRDEA